MWRALTNDMRLFAWSSADHWHDLIGCDIPAVHDALFPTDASMGDFNRLYRRPYITHLGAPVWAARAAADAAPGKPEAAEAIVDTYPAGWPHSGLYTATLGAGVSHGAGTGAGLAVQGALYDSQLGEQRRHAASGDTALTLLKSTMLLVPHDDTVHVMRSKSTVFAFRTVRPRWDEHPAWHDRVGYDLGVDTETSVARNTQVSVTATMGFLWPLFWSPHAHLLWRTGLAGLVWKGYGPTALAGAGVPLGLEGRYDAQAALKPWAALNVDAGPAWVGTWQWQSHVRATLGARVCGDCEFLGTEHVGLSMIAQGARVRDVGGREAWGTLGLLLE